MSPEVVLKFWFEELTDTQHFVKDPEVDQMIIDRFSELHKQARNCELYGWRETPEGSLAEIIVLDQFSRNMFRGSEMSFKQDALALALSQFAIQKGFDKNLAGRHLSFLYMPFMHSESLDIHNKAVELFSSPGLEGNLEYELKHKVIIERFGRYPHRNETLNRESTPEELDFLKTPGSSF